MILVTGASGLLGNNIVRLLVKRKTKVRVLCRTKSSSRFLQNLNVEVATGDVREAEAVSSAMRDVDQVIHAAGHVQIGWSQFDLHYDVNVMGTQNVAEAAMERGAKLVHVSSINALGLGGKELVAGEETARPGIVPCPYVVTKRLAEQNVMRLVEKGLNAVVVNPGFMLGPWDWKPSSGRMMLSIARHYLPVAPAGSICACDVRDVADGVVVALRSGKSGNRYVLGGHNVSYLGLWQQIASVVGQSKPWFRMGPLVRWGASAWSALAYRMTGQETDVNAATIGLSNQHHRFSSARAIADLGYSIRPLHQTLQSAWTWLVDTGYVDSIRQIDPARSIKLPSAPRTVSG